MAQAKTVEYLPCELTAEELLQRGDQLAQLAVAHASLKEEQKLASAAHKSKVEDNEAKQHKLVREIASKSEERPIECIEHPRYDTSMVEIRRADTGAVVRSRPMHPSERQAALDLGNATVTPIGAKTKKKKTESTEEESPDGMH